MKNKIVTTIFLISISVSVFASHTGGNVYVDVNGLVCDFCATSLEKVFGKQEAVDSVKVDLDKQAISIHFNEGQKLDDEAITQLITDSGYNVRGIRYDK